MHLTINPLIFLYFLILDSISIVFTTLSTLFLDEHVVKSIAQMQPAYAVLRDTSMKDDSTATNFEQIFKTYSPDTVTKIL